MENLSQITTLSTALDFEITWKYEFLSRRSEGKLCFFLSDDKKDTEKTYGGAVTFCRGRKIGRIQMIFGGSLDPIPALGIVAKT